MAEIREIIPQTNNKFLNMYEFRGKNKAGHDFRYFAASRAEKEEDLKAVSGENHPDGVIIYAVYREEGAAPAGGSIPSGAASDGGAETVLTKKDVRSNAPAPEEGPGAAARKGGDRVVLVREFRIPIGCYVYGFPAGLVEKGEDFHTAAVREMHEETGLDLAPLPADAIYEDPRFTSSGLTDESCAMVYGYASGTPTRKFLEESEEIQIVLADRQEARRILREERVALMCAYHLLYFISEEDPFAFLNLAKNLPENAGADIPEKSGSDLPEKAGGSLPIAKWIARAQEKGKASCREGESAVLIPILIRDGACHVLYEVRAAGLRTQPGEVCFPGGGIEPGEEPVDAAVREAMEELCVGRDQIEVIGAIDGAGLAPGGGTLHAFIGLIRGYGGTWSRDEVDRVFTTPLEWLLDNDPRVYKVKLEHQTPDDFPHESVPGGRSYKWKERYAAVPFYFGMPRFGVQAPYLQEALDEPVLWGATARVTDRFAKYLRSGRE